MKKILLVGPNSIHFWRYLQMVQDEFDEIMVITNEAPKHNMSLKIKLYIEEFSLRNPIRFKKTINNIKSKLKLFKPDVIHIHQANSSAFATIFAARDFNIPIIITPWGSDILLEPYKGLIYKEMAKFNLRKATWITSDSLYMANSMRELVPDTKLNIKIANFGIGITPDLSVKKENIIYSNRLHQRLYRIDSIIIQFKKFLQSQSEKWRLVIAGSGPLTEELKTLANSINVNEYIDFVGWVNAEKNAYYYNKAKIYVSIPASDATSISLLEALACGCIPVVSNLPANLEWVIDGLNGIVADNLDESFFNHSMELDDAMLKKVNQLLVEGKASVRANTEKFLSVYEEIKNRRLEK